MIHHIKVSYTLSRYYNIVNPGTRRSHLLIKENTNERDLPRRFPLALREWRKLGWMLPNPPFLSSLHIGRSYVNRVVRRIEAQKNERTATITNRTHVSHRACEVCFIRRQLVFPGFRGLIVPRLRESGGAKVRIRGGNQRSTVISHQIRRRDWPGWKSVETILKGAARDPETWRGRECCSIGRVFYFSANFIWILSYFIA